MTTTLKNLANSGTGYFKPATGSLTNRSGHTVIRWTNTGSQSYSVLTGTTPTLTNTSWTAPAGVTQIEVLVVAGGGAGHHNNSGGGGAGGLVYNRSFTVTPGNSYTVTVGAGGIGMLDSNAASRQTYQNGANSVFGSITAIGGGGGSGWNYYENGFDGGSGGGAGGNPTADVLAYRGGNPTANQGHAGGWGSNVQSGDSGGGGGGGAGGPGESAKWGGGTGVGGDGGPGLPISITGSTVYYAAGGGGGGGGGGQGGNGGFGQTAPEGRGGSNTGPYLAGQNAANSTGNGGGGGDNSNGGNGGSGVVVIRYQATGTATTGATRFNTTSKSMEYFNGTKWCDINHNPPSTVEILLVAGGGGTGGENSGAGGAGGLIYNSGYSITSDIKYTVTVGVGGLHGGYGRTKGFNGKDSVFDSLTAVGGGAGSDNYSDRSGGNGGSGGGGFDSPGVGGTGTVGQGNAGGTGDNSGGTSGSGPYRMGGGGGAGSAGNTLGQGSGGEGLPFATTGQSIFYAGGGSAGSDSNTCIAGTLGGGARGSFHSHGESGMNGSGGGGGGSGTNGPGARNGGNGGSGICVLRYPDVYSPAQTTSGGVEYIQANGFRIYKYLGSGTITF